jgi:hypothetical protein
MSAKKDTKFESEISLRFQALRGRAIRNAVKIHAQVNDKPMKVVDVVDTEKLDGGKNDINWKWEIKLQLRDQEVVNYISIVNRKTGEVSTTKKA